MLLYIYNRSWNKKTYCALNLLVRPGELLLSSLRSSLRSSLGDLARSSRHSSPRGDRARSSSHRRFSREGGSCGGGSSNLRLELLDSSSGGSSLRRPLSDLSSSASSLLLLSDLSLSIFSSSSLSSILLNLLFLSLFSGVAALGGGGAGLATPLSCCSSSSIRFIRNLFLSSRLAHLSDSSSFVFFNLV